MPYVRTVKTASGATAVQIVFSSHRGSRATELGQVLVVVTAEVRWALQGTGQYGQVLGQSRGGISPGSLAGLLARRRP